MNGMDERAHLAATVVERFADGDLPAPERILAERHLGACPRCRREVDSYRALFADLDRLEAAAPPFGFDLRILQAVFPRPSENAVLLRLATRAYAVLAVILAAVAGGVLLVAGPAPFENAVAGGIAKGVNGILNLFHLAGVAVGSVFKFVIDLLSLADAARALARGLEAAAVSLAPQVVFLVFLTVTLAALVLVWALKPVRERGVPHVSLSL